jgi:hypothetical protein
MTRAVPAPIVIREAGPRATTRHHKRGGRRHGVGGKSAEKTAMALALGAVAYSFVETQAKDKLPALPVVGVEGTVALAAHFIGKGRPGILTDIRNAAIVIAGYNLGKSTSEKGAAPAAKTP